MDTNFFTLSADTAQVIFGAGAFGGMFGAIRWGLTFFYGRQDIRQGWIDAKEALLEKRNNEFISTLQEQYDRVLERLAVQEFATDECERGKLELERRVAELEGYLLGRGEARQERQIIQSAAAIVEKGTKNDG